MGLKETIGNNLRELRERGGMSQAAVAKEIGLSQAAVAQFEKGKNCPSSEVILWYAEKFNASIDWIYGRKPSARIEPGSEEYRNLESMVKGIVDDYVHKQK